MFPLIDVDEGEKDELVLVCNRTGWTSQMVDLIALDHEGIHHVVPDQLKVRMTTFQKRGEDQFIFRSGQTEKEKDSHPVGNRRFGSAEKVVQYCDVMA